MTSPLPPIDWNVAAARGCAAPPPAIGRGASGVGLVAATGDGDEAGLAMGDACGAGVGGEVDVQLTSTARASTAEISIRLSVPERTRKLLLPRDDTDAGSDQPAGQDVCRVVQASVYPADRQA